MSPKKKNKTYDTPLSFEVWYPNSNADSSLIHTPINSSFQEKLPHNYKQFIDRANQQGFLLGNDNLLGVSSQTDVYPGLMTRQSLNIQLTYRYGNLSWTNGVNVNRYLYDGVQTQYGVFSNLSLKFSNHLSMTLYGQHYAVNPYYSMSTYPYISTSEYGGYISIHDDFKGLDVGVRRKYDPYRRVWYTVPIVTPFFKVGKVGVGLPLGDLLRSMFHDDEPNILPMRMEPPADRPPRPMRR